MLALMLSSAIAAAPLDQPILVLWEAENASDAAIAVSEPIEGLPASLCRSDAETHNRTRATHWFCLPEGEEPNP